MYELANMDLQDYEVGLAGLGEREGAVGEDDIRFLSAHLVDDHMLVRGING